MKTIGWAVACAGLACAAAGQPAGGSPADVAGLRLHYSFDADEDGIVRDASGNGRDGIVHGAQWVADGARGGAYRFDSNEQCIWADDAGLPQGDEPRTMAVWIKLNVLYPEMTTGLLTYGQLRWNQASGVGMDWRNGRDQYYFTQNGGVALSRQKMASPGEWHHLAYTYEGNGQHHLYVDGEPADGMSELGGPIDTVLSGRLMIGGHPGSVGPNGGYLDDVRIYGRALSGEEIAQLASRAPPPPLRADTIPDQETSAPETRSAPSGGEPGRPGGGVSVSAEKPEMNKIARGAAAAETMVLQWTSVPGLAYEVHWTADLSREFTVLASNLVAAGTEMAYTNAMDGARTAFYRVKRQE